MDEQERLSNMELQIMPGGNGGTYIGSQGQDNRGNTWNWGGGSAGWTDSRGQGFQPGLLNSQYGQNNNLPTGYQGYGGGGYNQQYGWQPGVNRGGMGAQQIGKYQPPRPAGWQ